MTRWRVHVFKVFKMVQRPKEREYEASPRKILALKKFTSVYHHTLRTEIQIDSDRDSSRLDESQSGIRIAGRSINNLRYADDTTLMAEREEELNNLLMRIKEDSK